MFAFTTRITPSANGSSDMRDVLPLQPLSGDSARALQIEGERTPKELIGLQAASSRFASVTVGCSPAPIADWARIGACRLRADTQCSAGIEARQRTAARADGVNVERGNAHRQTGNLGFVAGSRLTVDQRDIGRSSAHVEGDHPLIIR